MLATANVLTGILISTRILTGIAAKDIYFTSQLHHFLAYCLSLVPVIHIGLHWSYLCRAMKIKKDSLTEKILCGVIAATLFLILLGSNTVKKFFVPQPAPDFHYQAEKESTAPETEAENLEDNQEPQDTTAPPRMPPPNRTSPPSSSSCPIWSAPATAAAACCPTPPAAPAADSRMRPFRTTIRPISSAKPM